MAIVPHASTTDGPSASLVLGPVTKHFTNHGIRLSGGLGYGLAASFTSTPPAYTLETVLVASSKKFPSPGDSQPERKSMPAGGPNAGTCNARHE